MITKYINKVSARVFYLLLPSLLLLSFSSCGLRKQATTESETQTAVGPAFNADSAYLFCQQQCDFGPRTMNSKAHDDCEQWIINKFKGYGMTVVPQKCELKGYDGTILHSTNIIASYKPALKDRIMLCAHWDCRPWADNDPDEANWKKPVMAANDGASGIAVMLEIARLISISPDSCRLSPTLGLDFICFDAEDYGFPQWETIEDPGNTWALGSKYWAGNLHTPGYKARYGILLDMVGGQGAQFYQESMSKYYAKHIVDKVWRAAAVVGYGSSFPMTEGGGPPLPQLRAEQLRSHLAHPQRRYGPHRQEHLTRRWPNSHPSVILRKISRKYTPKQQAGTRLDACLIDYIYLRITP